MDARNSHKLLTHHACAAGSLGQCLRGAEWEPTGRRKLSRDFDCCRGWAELPLGAEPGSEAPWSARGALVIAEAGLSWAGAG